ncbi:MAG TPA: DoxX family protein [Thermoanaerobaculia bacterium]|nr:DoxX family protein [Thermoanaerobaculia bacterium]
MLVLMVLLAAWVCFRGAGALGVEAFASWPAAARWALAVMLLFTASAHFTSMREDLVRMVPSWVPWPRAVVYFTGACEVLGAVGLLVPAVRGYAGIALIVFFIAVFPANVRAARDEVSLRG